MTTESILTILALVIVAAVARALFPAHGTVKATGCSVAWSDTELAPLVPMQLEV